jgi:hypothetical protein
MKVYFGFDDTDHHDSPFGTGKLVRWFQHSMPDGCECLGVVRQQLLVCDEIPYTSHNSAACLIASLPEKDLLNEAIQKAADHLLQYAAEGSDPGLCVAAESDSSLSSLIEFGYYCTRAVVTQRLAMTAANKAHLTGHGGTNGGIIGAAAAVGLTASGWSGRFIEFANLRHMPSEVSVSELQRMGIEVVSIERDATVPAPEDAVVTNGWLRPRLLGHKPLLFVNPQGSGKWQNIYWKRKKRSDHPEENKNLRIKKQVA